MTESLKKALQQLDEDSLRQIARHCICSVEQTSTDSLMLPFTERWEIVRCPEFRALRALGEACEEALVVRHVNWPKAQSDV